MKLFKLSLGSNEKFGVAKDYDDMHEKRAELDPTFAFTPVVIEEVKIDGYDIVVKKVKDNEREEGVDEPPAENVEPPESQPPESSSEEPEEPPVTPFDDWEREDLKKFLDERGIEYDGRISEPKLRELVLKNA
jgi:hypothetical protein